MNREAGSTMYTCSMILTVKSPGASVESRQREPFPNKCPREASQKAWWIFLRVWGVLSQPRQREAGSLTSHLLSRSSPHLLNRFVAASHTLARLAHPPLLLRPTFELPPWHRWGCAVHPAGRLGDVPSPPNPSRCSRTPRKDLYAGGRRERKPPHSPPPLSSFPEVPPRFANFLTGLPRGPSGQGRPAIRTQEPDGECPARGARECTRCQATTPYPHPQRSLPRRQQLPQRQLLASLPQLGLLPSSSSIVGQTGKTSFKFATST